MRRADGRIIAAGARGDRAIHPGTPGRPRGRPGTGRRARRPAPAPGV